MDMFQKRLNEKMHGLQSGGHKTYIDTQRFTCLYQRTAQQCQ